MNNESEKFINILEMVVRCFDCCLSCAAHITVVDEEGKEIYFRKLDTDSG